MVGLAEVAALVTVAGAAIYALGLLGLAWPIHKRWNVGASATWYAMSLVPRTMVAGQGMRIFVGFPTTMALLLLAWWLIVFPTLRVLSVAVSDLAAWVVGVIALLALLAGGYRALTRYRRRLQWLLGPTADAPRSRWLVWLAVGTSVPAIFVAGRLAAGAIQVRAGFPFVTFDPNPLIAAIVVAFLASFLLQLIDATAIDPPLPTVEIALADEPRTFVVGKLLTHAEGVIHFFDERRELTSMPDGKVASVRLRREEAQP